MVIEYGKHECVNTAQHSFNSRKIIVQKLIKAQFIYFSRNYSQLEKRISFGLL